MLRIVQRGIGQTDQENAISKDGEITLPDLAPLQVSGLTIEEVEAELTDILQIDDASAEVFATLSSARLIPVQITGAVENPQTLAVPAYNPLSRILRFIGKLQPQGSLRNITLLQDKGRHQIDYYDNILNVDRFKDPLIVGPARIHISDLGNTFAVAGFVGRPSIFELPANQNQINVVAALRLANVGILPPGAKVEILQFDGDGRVFAQDVKDPETTFIKAGTALRIVFVETRNLSEIQVSGAVLSPYSLIGSDPIRVADAIKSGASLNKDAILSFALVEPIQEGTFLPRAIDLRHALESPADFVINPGERLLVFDIETYQNLISIDRSGINDTVGKILRSAMVSEVFLDKERLAFLAPQPQLNVQEVISTLFDLPDDIVFDFALIFDPNGRDTRSSAISLSQAIITPEKFQIAPGMRLQLFTSEFLKDFKLDPAPSGQQSRLVYALENAAPARIYLDGNEISKLPSKSVFAHSEIAGRLRNMDELYPLYAGVQTRSSGSLFFDHKAVRADELLNLSANVRLAPSQRLDFYTKKFVRDTLVEEETEIIRPGREIFAEMEENILVADKTDLKDANVTGVQIDAREVANAQQDSSAQIALTGLKKAGRLISGSVETPGFYPVAGRATLSEMLSIAQGTTQDADLRRVQMRQYATNVNGVTTVGSTRFFDVLSRNAAQVALNGDFDIFVAGKVNDAAVGVIDLQGEVLRPGEYRFSRNETLHDVIARAGGLTNIAYPLGAVFSRETLRIQQRAANSALARQVEKSVLLLSQSQRDGAGEQIKAILGYAEQVSRLPVTGRQSVNIALKSQSNRIFLEDGDRLVVPKRPSHVSIIGSVYNQVSAQYGVTKTYSDYLKDAGGMDRLADDKNIFLLLPNGESEPLLGNSSQHTIIPTGSVIVVPPKTDKLSALGLSQIISQILGNIATSVLAINNIK